MTDRERIERDREIARKAWEAARRAPSRWGTEAAEFAVWADREFPLPAPEPQRAVGPSGTVFMLQPGPCRAADVSLTSSRFDGALISKQDRATVANLLVPFEDVVRATLEEMEVTHVKHANGCSWVAADFPGAVSAKCGGLPAILKRLEGR